MIFVGVDWAEAHNDVLVMDEGGVVLGRGRFSAGVAGLAQLHALVADHTEDPGEVIVGIEIDRGLLVDSLVGVGYRIYAVNPLAASRYRDRHTTSGAKSDAGDAKLLADLVRTDRQNHRPVAGDTEEAGAIRVLARAHQALIWARQRQVNALRSALRDYFPAALEAFGTELAHTDALAILAIASVCERARGLSRAKIAAALRCAGRQRNIEQRAIEICAALRTEQPEGPARIAEAFGAVSAARVAVLCHSTSRSPSSSERSLSILIVTRTPRSCTVFPDSAWSSAPGCLASSVMTRVASPMIEAARPTQEPPPSPGRRVAAWSCWRGWRATVTPR